MSILDYVADEIRKSLNLFDHRKDGNYSVYIAKVAIAAVREAKEMGLGENTATKA